MWYSRTLLVTLLLATAVQAIRVIVSYQAVRLGATPLELGILGASFAALALFVAIPAGRLADRLGEAVFMAGGTALIAVMAPALVFANDVAVLVLLLAIVGLGQTLGTVALQTLVANAVDDEQRGSRFGGTAVMVSLGQAIGPAMATSLWHDGRGATRALMAAMVIGLAAAVISATLRRVSNTRDERTAAAKGATLPAVWTVLRAPGMREAMFASFAVLSTIDVLVTYLPAYGDSHGIAPGIVGLLLATRAIASMSTRLSIGVLTRALGLHRLLIVSIVMSAAALGVLPAVGSVKVLFVLMVFVGFGLGLGQPLTMAWVAGRAPAGLRGTALGLRLSGNRLGQLSVPFGVGAVAGATGIGAIFITLCGLLAGSALLVARNPFEKAPRRSSRRDEGP
jgi:MFS family permease